MYCRQVEMMNRLDEIEKSLGESTYWRFFFFLILKVNIKNLFSGGKDLGLALHSRRLVRDGLLYENLKNEDVCERERVLSTKSNLMII